MNEISELTFKGDRRYLQSASVFDDLVSRLEAPVSDIDFIFHRQTMNQVRYITEAPVSASDLVASWRDSKRQIFVVDSGLPVTESTPYDEAALVEMLAFDADKATVPAALGEFTFLEGIVAAFKHLLIRRYPERRAKYVFVRLRLKHVPHSKVTVRYSRQIGGFFQSVIESESCQLGQLFYGEWK